MKRRSFIQALSAFCGVYAVRPATLPPHKAPLYEAPEIVIPEGIPVLSDPDLFPREDHVHPRKIIYRNVL